MPIIASTNSCEKYADRPNQTNCQAPRRPPYKIIGRDELLTQLKERLLAGGTLALLSLQCLPGVGKTALAIEIANDTDILKTL